MARGTRPYGVRRFGHRRVTSSWGAGEQGALGEKQRAVRRRSSAPWGSSIHTLEPESPLMLTPTELYPLLERLLQSSRLISHATARTAVARLLATLLVAQDLRPSAVTESAGPCARAARHRFGSVRRALHGSQSASGALSPFLIRAAWPGCSRQPRRRAFPGSWRSIAALRTVEGFTIELVVPGRAMPLACAVLPYPWPRGPVSPDRRWAGRRACCDRGRWGCACCLLADRAFPAKSFFRTLQQGSATGRCGEGAPRGHAGRRACRRVRAAAGRRGSPAITIQRVTFGAGAEAVTGGLVIARRELAVVPPDQRGAAHLAERARKGEPAAGAPGTRTGGASRVRVGTWLVVFTTAVNPLVAVASMGSAGPSKGPIGICRAAGMGSTAGTSTAGQTLDASTGGGCARGLLGARGAGPDRTGARTECHGKPGAVREALERCATTDRLSWWWRGRCVLEERNRRSKTGSSRI